MALFSTQSGLKKLAVAVLSCACRDQINDCLGYLIGRLFTSTACGSVFALVHWVYKKSHAKNHTAFEPN
jgi:CBS-domain-containing membrane protein